MRVADIADQRAGPLLDAAAARRQGHELQGHAKATGRPRLPDLAEPAPAEEALERIARHRLAAFAQPVRSARAAFARGWRRALGQSRSAGAFRIGHALTFVRGGCYFATLKSQLSLKNPASAMRPGKRGLG